MVMEDYKVNRFVSHDLHFEGEGVEMNTNKPKRNLDDYLKTGTKVTLKTREGLVKIIGLWQLKDDKLYDYVGNSVDVDNDNSSIYFNNEDIEDKEVRSR
jgi:hypothetical protein